MKSVVGSYALQSEIGKGATSSVFLATHTETGDKVSIKLFRKDLFSDPVANQRIQRELNLATSLHHPNIVSVKEVLANTPPALVMSYIEGKNLEQLQPNLPYVLPEVSVLIVIEILKGLQYAHEQGVIHRDLKPSNILVGTNGRVYVSDFGLAKMIGASTLTETNVLVGSLDYISPEQSNGDTLTFASDLFSVGSMLYFLTTGTRPFSRNNIASTIAAVQSEDPDPPQNRNPKLSPTLSRIIRKALTKDPAARFSSALEFQKALESHLASLGLAQADTTLTQWFSDPTGFTLDSLQRSAISLTSHCENLLDEGKTELFLESVAHLSARAPGSAGVSRLTLKYELAEKKRKRKKTFLIAGGVWAFLVIVAAGVAIVMASRPEIEEVSAPTATAPALTSTQAAPPSDPVVSQPLIPKKRVTPPKPKEPPAPTGSVQFTVPEDAEIFWDYKRIRRPEEVLENQKVGKHKLIINRPGFELFRKDVEIVAGKITEVRHE